MRRFLLVASFLPLGLAATANAQEAGGAASTDQTATDDIVVTKELPVAKKKVCKSSMATGSIMSKRICRTQEEWEVVRERSITQVEKYKDELEAREQARQLMEAGQ